MCCCSSGTGGACDAAGFSPVASYPSSSEQCGGFIGCSLKRFFDLTVCGGAALARVSDVFVALSGTHCVRVGFLRRRVPRSALARGRSVVTRSGTHRVQACARVVSSGSSVAIRCSFRLFRHRRNVIPGPGSGSSPRSRPASLRSAERTSSPRSAAWGAGRGPPLEFCGSASLSKFGSVRRAAGSANLLEFCG